MNAAVGPLSTSPPTIGLTPPPARRRGQRLAHARHGEDRRDRRQRVGRADHDRARAGDRRRAPAAVGRACSAPRNSSPSTGPAARSRIMNSWKERQPCGVAHPRAHRVVAHRQHARSARRCAAFSRASAAVGRAPFGEHARALHAPGEIAVAEVEPDIRPERPQGVHHRKAVVAQAPAALVDLVGQPEGDQVGVGRDVRAVDLDVVAGVGDHHQALGARPRRAIPRASFAPPVPPASTTTSPRRCASRALTPTRGSGRPVRRMPACTL